MATMATMDTPASGQVACLAGLTPCVRSSRYAGSDTTSSVRLSIEHAGKAHSAWHLIALSIAVADYEDIWDPDFAVRYLHADSIVFRFRFGPRAFVAFHDLLLACLAEVVTRPPTALAVPSFRLVTVRLGVVSYLVAYAERNGDDWLTLAVRHCDVPVCSW